MLVKIKEILNSLRFWQVTFATGFILAGHYLPDMSFLWNSLAAWLATVAGIGTLDSIAEKSSGSTVSVGNPSDASRVTVNTSPSDQ